jgi:hypothetical protein
MELAPSPAFSGPRIASRCGAADLANARELEKAGTLPYYIIQEKSGTGDLKE